MNGTIAAPRLPGQPFAGLVAAVMSLLSRPKRNSEECDICSATLTAADEREAGQCTQCFWEMQI